MEPLVSVIVPVFNVLPYLREALDSVLSQTYSNLEILIVDDGSTDGSGDICDEYCKDPRVQVIHQENQGLSAARNAGLDRMTGDIVAFLDSDDAYYPDMIRTLLAAMHRSGADIVIGGYAIRHEGKHLIRCRKGKGFEVWTETVLTSQEALLAWIKGILNPHVWNKLYVRKLWKNLRFPVGRVYEDVFTGFCALSQAEAIVTVPKIQMLHRIRSGSITQTGAIKSVWDRMHASECLERFVNEHIPMHIDDKFLHCVQKKNFRGEMAAWCHLSWKDQANAEDVRQIILAKGKTLGVDDMSIRVKILFFLMRFCPCLVPVVYSIYKHL